jgi:spore maturation protein CgeB
VRIFQILEANANTAVAANQTWLRNLHEPLLDLGHEVVLFSASDGRQAMARNDVALRARFSQHLVETFRNEHARRPFDLVFAYLMDGMIDPAAIDEIRRSGVPTTNFSCNNAHQFDLVDEISPHFDVNLHAEKDARSKFLAIGANPLWWPMASNPTYFKPLDVPRTVDASFVGANYALRARYIVHLLQNQVDAHVYGPGWLTGDLSRRRALTKRYYFLALAAFSPSAPRRTWASAKLEELDFRSSVARRFPANVHPPVSDDELVALYSRSHVSLGFLEVYDGHDPTRPITQHLHLREFEAPMCGALYCTGYLDELAEHFEPDKEVVVYRNQHELLDKVRFYLAHPDAAASVRAAGLRRALADHTYQRRFQTLFRELGLECA